MKKYIEIRKNEYYDSVTLMSLSAQIKKRDDVDNIVVSMGTAMNKELLEHVGLSNDEVESCDENDLMIAFEISDSTEEEEIKQEIERRLKGDESGKEHQKENYTSLKQAMSQEEEADLVVISVPGEYAGREARVALKAGKNVMLFSDNITVMQEKELKELDDEFKDIVSNGRHRMIVVADKFPFRYFAKEYGLSYRAAFSGCSTDTEPSAKTIAYLIDRIREKQIQAVFYLELSSHRTADIISEETGAKPLLLHSCHSVTRRQFDEGVTYLQLMKQNAKNLREALL